MKTKIICSFLFCCMHSCAMDVPLQEENPLQKIYGKDSDLITSLQLINLGSTENAMAVSVKFDKFTYTVHITEKDCTKKEKDKRKWIVEPSLINEIRQKFEESNSRENILSVVLNTGSTSECFTMDNEDVAINHDAYDLHTNSLSYYIKDCDKVHDCFLDNTTQVRVRHMWSLFYDKPELRVIQHPFSIRVFSNNQPEETLYCSTLNDECRKKIVSYIENAQPFFLTLASLYKDHVEDRKLIINTFEQKPVIPNILNSSPDGLQTIEKSLQSSWHAFILRARIIVPFCCLIAILIHQYLKKG